MQGKRRRGKGGEKEKKRRKRGGRREREKEGGNRYLSVTNVYVYVKIASTASTKNKRPRCVRS